jgi:Ca2+-binding RTX toxin-like protein
LVGVAIAGGSAQAATVSVESGTLVYAADAGEENFLFVYPSQLPGYTGVYDDGASITPGSGCMLAVEAYPEFIPPYVGLYYICSDVTNGVNIDLDDGDDLGVMGVGPVTMKGGAGNDELVGTEGDDVIDAGPGDDRVIGDKGNDKILGGDGADQLDGEYLEFPEDLSEIPEGTEDFRGLELTAGGADVLDGGPGDDTLRGNAGTDAIQGGPGNDTADYSLRRKKSAVVLTLDGVANDGAPGEKDAIGGDVEAVFTGPGNDRVMGNSEANKIDTGDGDDVVDAGEGADAVKLGAGNDHASLRDESVDSLDCGAGGTDTALVDARDAADGCETLERAALKPVALTLQARSRPRSGGTVRVRMSGKLKLPTGADKRACVGSAVKLVVRGGGRSASTTAIFGGGCKYTASVSIKAARALKAQALFVGSPTLAHLNSRRVRVRH